MKLKSLRETQAQDTLPIWRGTFAQYWELVEQNPHLAQNAHQRLFAMLTEDGRDASGYRFFRDHLFGVDDVLNRIIDEYFRPAAMGYDVKNRLLLLVGPVSSGKSTFVQLLKRGLERFSRTERGAVYAIAGCPMHSDPLLLLGPTARAEAERRLGIRIAGELNPYTRWMVQERYDGDIERVPVERIAFSETARVGIGTFSPSDPKSQDVSELIGSLDFVGIAQYGTESDPRAYRFDGELNIANRGMMEFQEILKCDEKFLYPLLSLTQEGNFKTGRYALISADEVIVAHTNEAEWERFVSNPRNEALLSRMFVMRFPYHRSVTAETRMLQARTAAKPAEFEPFALETAAAFVVHSRSEDGMRGVDPRFVINTVSAILANADRPVDAVDILSAFRERIPELPGVDTGTVERYLDLLHHAHIAYRDRLKALVVDALGIADEERRLLERYVDHLNRWDPEDARPDPVMDEVEAMLSIPANAKAAFRQEVAERVRTRGAAFLFDGHPAVKSFLRERVFDRIDRPEIIRDTLTRAGFSPDGAQRWAGALIDPVDTAG